MDSIAARTILRRRPDVRFRIVDGEAVVIRQSAAEVIVLNEVGARILALADGAAPVAVWIDSLLAEYEVEREVLERDVLAFAAELAEQGLLEPLSLPVHPPELAHGPDGGEPDGL